MGQQHPRIGFGACLQRRCHVAAHAQRIARLQGQRLAEIRNHRRKWREPLHDCRCRPACDRRLGCRHIPRTQQHLSALVGGVVGDTVDAIRHLRAVAVVDQQRIVRLELQVRALQIHTGLQHVVLFAVGSRCRDCGLRIAPLRLRLAHRDLAPFGPRGQKLGGFEGLRLFAGGGHALHARTDRNIHGRGIRIDRIGEIYAGRYTRPHFITGQAAELQQGIAFGCGAQIAFVGDALLIERQHIAGDRPDVAQGNRRIGRIAHTQRREFGKVRTRQTRMHRFDKRCIRARTMMDFAQTGTVFLGYGRRRARAGATTAIAAHRPPPMLRVSLPCSG